MDKIQIENLKVFYPKYTKVCLDYMRDEFAPPPGTIGYVNGVDDMGTCLLYTSDAADEL